MAKASPLSSASHSMVVSTAGSTLTSVQQALLWDSHCVSVAFFSLSMGDYRSSSIAFRPDIRTKLF